MAITGKTAKLAEDYLRKSGQLPPKKERLRLIRKHAAAKRVQKEAAFVKLCRAHGLPDPIPEYQFAPPRKWRFDFVWPGADLAVEIQGGLFTGGRHVQGAALLREHEKLNEAAVRGWHVLFCTPADVESGAVFGVIRRALQGDQE